MTSMTFLDLGFDIQVAILLHLCSTDILAMRMTCSSLYCVSKQRIIWIEALERMCQKNTIFRPSFEVPKLTLDELERATTGPDRWEAMMASRNAARPATLRTRCLQNEIGFLQTCLIPGGRFLLTLDSHRSIALWDIHNLPEMILDDFGDICQEIATEPLAVLNLRCNYFAVAYCPKHESSFKVVVNSLQTHYVFEISPTQHKPQFHLLNSLYIPNQDGLSAVCGNLMFLPVGSIAVIWNFREDTWVAWRAPDRCMADMRPQMSNDFIVLVDMVWCDVSVYKIPPLKANARALALGFEDPVPILRPEASWGLRDPFGTSKRIIGRKGLCEWYNGSGQPLWFDLVDSGSQTPREVLITRYEIKLPPETKDVKMVRRFVFSPTSDNQVVGLTAGYRICGENFVMWWYPRQDEIRCVMGAMAATDENQAPNIIRDTVLCPKEGASHGGSSLCPVSGRLAYVADDTLIKVLDFTSSS